MVVDSFTRNFIAKSLGVLWIFDGFLQFQPKMLGASFVTSVLVPNLSGQPPILQAIVAYGIYLWNLNPVLSDIGVAFLQITIGILLFFPSSDRRYRLGLYVSILWGMVVWFCGEGAGLLFTGNGTFYTGAPGAVLFYVALAPFLLLGEKVRLDWLPRIAGWTFLLGAALQLQPVFWTTGGIQTSIMAATMEPFHELSAFPTYLSSLLALNPMLGNMFLVLILCVIGLAILLKPSRTTGVIALIFLLFVWWWGQDFGMLTTLNATSTDPNTAPLLALFLLPILYNRESITRSTKPHYIPRFFRNRDNSSPSIAR